MIEYIATSEGERVSGIFKIKGDEEVIANEIYTLLIKLAAHCPTAFDVALEALNNGKAKEDRE